MLGSKVLTKYSSQPESRHQSCKCAYVNCGAVTSLSEARLQKLFKATSVICLTLLMVNAYIYCNICMFENAQIFQLGCAASSATQYGCMYLFICSVAASQFSFHSFFTLAFQQLLTHPHARAHRRLVFILCAVSVYCVRKN